MTDLGLTGQQAAAHARLQHAIGDALKAGCIIPCLLNPEGWFPKGSPVKAREAVEWCHTCPVLDECRAYADTTPLDNGPTSKYHRTTAVLGGQWWAGNRILNPYPIRKRTCTNCGHTYKGDRHRLCRSCRYEATKETAA
jgi:hypothetical protein